MSKGWIKLKNKGRCSVNIKEIKEMINLMNENNLMELEVEKEGMRIKLRRSSSGEVQATPIVIEREAKTQEVHPHSPSKETGALPENVIEIKSPMVGTFYRASSPEAPPFVEVGQVIEPGQVICIIEAMKLMNEIKSEVKGRITEILIDNTEPVEYGQSLFLVLPI